MKRRTLLARGLHIGGAAAVAALAMPATLRDALAQGEAVKAVRIVVPFAPGGSGDITARMLAEVITRKTGQQAVVENKPGANGIIGVEAVRRAPADGSVLLLATTSTHLANPSLYKALPYDPEKDFRLVGNFGSGSMLVVVRPGSPYRTLDDLVADARAHPDKLNYGHFNASSHIPGAVLGRLAGVRLTPVAYKQISSAMIDLISGQLDVIFVDSVAGDSYLASGQLRAIAAAGIRRLPRYPDVPLVTERYPDYNVSGGMLGIAVPAATPLRAQQELNELINDAISSAPMKGRLEDLGFHPARMSLADLAVFVSRERRVWKEQVDLAGIAPQ